MTDSADTEAAIAAVRASVRQLNVLHEEDGVKLTQTRLEPGEEIPWHTHTEVTDTFYAVIGPVTIETKDPEGVTRLQPGDVFQTAVAQPHRVSNGADHPVQFLLIQSGGTFDFVPL